MRVTSNTYTDLVINSSQAAQQRLSELQQQIASGNTVQFASDDPATFQKASQSQTSLASLTGYGASITTASTLTSANNSAMTSLHQIMASASELGTTVSTAMTPSDLKNVGTQMSALINQLTSVVNQQVNGAYLFGGTANVPPITSSTQTYNTASNGNTTSIEVGQGNSVPTSIVAGQSGTPGVDGFLYDSASGVDVLASLKQAVTDLNSGNASAFQSTDLPALNKALDHISLYVGSTAANMSAVQSADTMNQSQITAQTNQLNSLTQTNLPNATIQLQQIQMQYQATLQAGTRIMSLSILNYLPSS